MNVNSMRYFAALAEYESYTKAADALAIAQSTLSEAIGRFEQEVGFELVDHKKRKVVLTDEGAAFLPYVKGSISLYEQGLDKMRETSENKRPSLFLGVVFSCQDKAWSTLIYRLRLHYDFKLNVEINQTTTRAILNDLRCGKLDVGFSGRLPGYDDLVFRSLWSSSLVAVVRKEHPIAQKDSIDVHELEGFRLATYTEDGPMGQEMKDSLAMGDYNIVHRQLDEISLCSLALANPDMLALVCDTWITKAFSNDLVVIPISGIRKDFHWLYLVYRQDGIMSEPAHYLVDLIESTFHPE